MRYTSQVPLEIGGALFVTYDSAKKDFERELGEIMLNEGGIQ